MTDMQDYEARLRVKIEEQGKAVESAYQDLRRSEAHPMSGEYKMWQQMAMMNAGQLMGLLLALQELTGDDSWSREYTTKIEAWIAG